MIIISNNITNTVLISGNIKDGSLKPKGNNYKIFTILSNKIEIECTISNKLFNKDIIKKNNNVLLHGQIIFNDAPEYNIFLVQSIKDIPDDDTKQLNYVLISGNISDIFDKKENTFVNSSTLNETSFIKLDNNLIELSNYDKDSNHEYNILKNDSINVISYLKKSYNESRSNIIPIIDGNSAILDITNSFVYIGGNLINNEKFKESNNNSFKFLSTMFKQTFKNIQRLYLTATKLDQQIYRDFVNFTKENNFYYSKKDLLNFHICMKNTGMVILSGLSGTGKTQLVRLYSKVLGLTDNQFTFIPVKPYWTDDSDMLGFFNPISHKYQPNSNGLINTLIKAYNNPNKLFIVLLDEMNLSNVEYYFSQFLSILELPLNNPNRCIKLYNKHFDNDSKGQFPNHIPKGHYPYKIPVKNNILFVGTINNDESTHKISDKVLDRSNVIRLHKMPFSLLTQSKHTLKDIKYIQFKTISTNKFQSLKGESISNKLNKSELQLIDKLNDLLQSTSDQLGIGWRVIKQINEYLCDIPNNSILTKSSAFDYQLSQRILNKINGSENQLISIIGHKYSSNDNSMPGKIEVLLNNYTKEHPKAKFPRAKNTIYNKAKELRDYGFTM